MTDKSSFTPDEWKLLLESVMAASIAITAAEPSGLWGLLKESFVGGTELTKAKMNPETDALITGSCTQWAWRGASELARAGHPARVPDGMARDTAWARARSAFRRMARQTGRSKARVISGIARLAGGSTALRRARQRLFRLYVRPVVIHDGHHCRTPIRPRSGRKPPQSAHQLLP